MLEAVKENLQVTWDDEDTRLGRLIVQGMAELNELCGAELDFSGEGLARSLLFDHIRYAYNNASEYFDENFHSKILRLQLLTGAAEMEEADEAED